MSNRDKLVSSLNEEDDSVVLARIRDGEKDARRLGFGMLCSSSNGIEMMENGDCQKCDLTEGKFIVNILSKKEEWMNLSFKFIIVQFLC